VSQRILGEEQFIDKVMEKIDERFENKRKHHEYSLKKIVETIEKMRGITLSKVIGKSRRREILSVRKLVSIVEREFGYKGKEIALFLQKDPSVITRYLKEGENFKMDVKRALDLLND
jgi:chromosomal replication initiation ATPase DnaA